ncbi:MAG: glutathione-regulated potassium-efflux system protein [Chlorobiales bacterium]|nr:glutathione-regulated potassium-efflux system protein [Chlorobiales bacterium]
MHEFDFLGELILIGSLAIAIILIFQKIRVPPVIGLIVTGIVLGPSGFGVVYDSGLVSTLAELGVILLLFTIGLEFSLDELVRLKKIVLVGGLAQIILTGISIGFLSFWFMTAIGRGISINEAAFLGFAFSVSSTAICLKILSDREELDLQYGRIALGILIFQDIAIVPLMIGITFLNPDKTPSFETIAKEIGIIVLFGVGIFGGFRLLMPKIVKVIASLHAKEVLVLGALVLCFGAAYLTSLIGLSLALGSFVAGMVIASTDESHQIARTIDSFREAFTSVFFVSVGLLLDVRVIDLPVFIGIAVWVLLVKGILVASISLFLGYSVRVSVMAGMALAQIGEFSFVLAETGLKNNVIDHPVFQSMLVIIVVTMVVTPAMVAVAPHVADQVIPALGFIPLAAKGSEKISAPAESTIIGPGEVHAAIIGFGINGQNVAAVLRATNISYTVLEIDREVVRKMKERGEPIYYGDCTEKKAMQRAGIDHARAIVIGISDTKAIAQSIKAIREINIKAFIIVRTRTLPDVEHLYKAGADVVVTEKFETSIQILQKCWGIRKMN